MYTKLVSNSIHPPLLPKCGHKRHVPPYLATYACGQEGMCRTYAMPVFIGTYVALASVDAAVGCGCGGRQDEERAFAVGLLTSLAAPFTLESLPVHRAQAPFSLLHLLLSWILILKNLKGVRFLKFPISC